MLRVNGLFGHIQRNNAKTLALLALFLVLLEAMQITVRLMPMAMMVRIHSQFDGIQTTVTSQFDRIESTLPPTIEPASSNRLADGVATPGGGRWIGTPPTLPGAGRAKPRSTESDPLVEAVTPARPQGSGLFAVWDTFARKSSFFSRDWYLIILIGLVYVMGSCWWSAQLMRYETRARPLSRKDGPDLYNLVENLALSIGLSCPRIEVIESPALNAYAAGFFPNSSTIAVTTGLIHTLSRDELEAVLAHEMVHIRDRDVRLMMMVRACVDLVLLTSRSAINQAKKRPLLGAYFGILMLAYLGVGFALVFAAIFLVVTALAIGARFAISRTREFTADAGAIDLTKNPAALVTALRKVAGSEELALKGYATRAMMFSSRAETFLSTHPSIEDRIAAIKLHGGVQEHEIPDHRTIEWTVSPGAPAPAFGRKRVLHGLAGELPMAADAVAPAVPMATAPVGQPPKFGRRPHAASATSPGDRPISAPNVVGGVEVPDSQHTWAGRWIASGRVDRISKGVVKVLMVPQLIAAYIGAAGAAFAIVMSLLMINPLLGLAAAVLIGWFVWKRFVRFFGALVRRFADA